LVVVHSSCGMILLLKRVDMENFWQSVTGSLCWGEVAPAAAVRELREETGIDAGRRLVDWHHSVSFDIIDRFRPRYHPDTRKNIEHMFSIEIERDHPIACDPREHVAHAWKGFSEAMDLVWSWSNRDAIAAIAKRQRR